MINFDGRHFPVQRLRRNDERVCKREAVLVQLPPGRTADQQEGGRRAHAARAGWAECVDGFKRRLEHKIQLHSRRAAGRVY